MLHQLCAAGMWLTRFFVFLFQQESMSPLELDQLQQCPDIATLRTVLGTLCARFGTVTQLNILPAAHAGKHQALCFLRMATDE